MKALVIYGSTRGNTRTVVNRLPTLLDFPVHIADVKTLNGGDAFEDYDLLMFFASTWGDQELQVDMERFLAHQTLQLDGKPFAICELGNYFGYDDFGFGAERILRCRLEEWGGTELIEPFSMDSFPYRDWNGLTRWCDLLNLKVSESVWGTWTSSANYSTASDGSFITNLTGNR
jgi:flavodoxin